METLENNRQRHFSISSSTIADCEVRTPRDEKVGSIKDIMLDTMSGEISYLVLAVDKGFLNMGTKLLALPFESFQFDTQQDDVLIVKESKEKLENAPGFDDDNWPSGPQDQFIDSIRTYYGNKNRGNMDGNRDGGSRDRLGDNSMGTSNTRNETIADHQTGNKFLEKDRTESRDLDNRRGGNPVI